MHKFWQKKYISKYTGKEIDDAVAKAGTALQNPMTAAGDLIVGGEDGAAEKLAKGTDGKVLKMVSGAPAWADDSSGMSNPMTTAGDLIVGGEDGAAGRLAKGTDGQVLSMVSGAPAWAAAGGGKYAHFVTMEPATASFGCKISFMFISDSGTALTTSTFFTTIRNLGYTSSTQPLPVTAFFHYDSKFYIASCMALTTEYISGIEFAASTSSSNTVVYMKPLTGQIGFITDTVISL